MFAFNTKYLLIGKEFRKHTLKIIIRTIGTNAWRVPPRPPFWYKGLLLRKSKTHYHLWRRKRNHKGDKSPFTAETDSRPESHPRHTDVWERSSSPSYEGQADNVLPIVNHSKSKITICGETWVWKTSAIDDALLENSDDERLSPYWYHATLDARTWTSDDVRRNIRELCKKEHIEYHGMNPEGQR